MTLTGWTIVGVLVGILVTGFLLGVGVAASNAIGWGMVAFVIGFVYSVKNS